MDAGRRREFERIGGALSGYDNGVKNVVEQIHEAHHNRDRPTHGSHPQSAGQSRIPGLSLGLSLLVTLVTVWCVLAFLLWLIT